MKIEVNEIRSFLKNEACAVDKEGNLIYANDTTNKWDDVLAILEKKAEERYKRNKHNRILYSLNIIMMLIMFISGLRFQYTNGWISFIISIISGIYLILFAFINYD